MQRIVIIGCSGSGKSTLARELGRRLALPVTHLDALYWRPGWKPPPDRAAFDARVLEIAAGDRWIIDGSYSSTLPQRLQRADAVILTDFPTWLCLWRVCWRVVQYRGKTRPDIGPDCPEKVDLEFLRFVWTYRKVTLPKRESNIAAHFGGKPTRLRSRRDVEAFLAAVPATDAMIRP
jgi:adenylate kinase family enzyme